MTTKRGLGQLVFAVLFAVLALMMSAGGASNIAGMAWLAAVVLGLVGLVTVGVSLLRSND